MALGTLHFLMLILYPQQRRRLHSFTGSKRDSKEKGDKSYPTLLLIHSFTEMARPKDVHVLTLIERLFVPTIQKKKKKRSRTNQPQKVLFLLGCQHQTMPWILTEPGQRKEGNVSNSKHSFFSESYFKNQRSQYCPKEKVSCGLSSVFIPWAFRHEISLVAQALLSTAPNFLNNFKSKLGEEISFEIFCHPSFNNWWGKKRCFDMLCRASTFLQILV